MGRKQIAVPQEVRDHLVRRLIWLVGCDTLQNPSKKLERRIQLGAQRFFHEWALARSARPLEKLAGYRSTGIPLDQIRLALPNLNKTKETASWLRLKHDYLDARARAQAVFRSKAGKRVSTREAALVKAFPQVPASILLEDVATAGAVAVSVVRHLHVKKQRKQKPQKPRSRARIARLVYTPPRNIKTLLDRESLTPNSLDADLICVLRAILYAPPDVYALPTLRS